jgi:trigger factor
MSLFNILSREGVGTGLEDVVSDTIIEKEHVIVARLLNFAQLKKANKAVVIEQYMVKVDKTDKNAGSGSIRIRKVTDRKGNVTYEMTTKNNVKDGRIETTTVANEMMFKQMQALAEGGMLKHRYSFNIKGTDFVWEVDVVPDGSGGYKQWCLCECEVADLDTQKPELPIETEEAYLSPSLNDKADEETFMAKKREVLERFFIQDNPFLKEKAELTQLKGEDSVEEENNEAASEEKTDEVTTGEETLSVDNITDEKEVADKVEERAEQILEKQEPEEDATEEGEESGDESTEPTEEGSDSNEEDTNEEDTTVEAEEGDEETEVSQDSFHDILSQLEDEKLSVSAEGFWDKYQDGITWVLNAFRNGESAYNSKAKMVGIFFTSYGGDYWAIDPYKLPNKKGAIEKAFNERLSALDKVADDANALTQYIEKTFVKMSNPKDKLKKFVFDIGAKEEWAKIKQDALSIRERVLSVIRKLEKGEIGNQPGDVADLNVVGRAAGFLWITAQLARMLDKLGAEGEYANTEVSVESVIFTEDTIQHMVQLGNENYTPSIGQAVSSANQIIGRKANFVFDKLGSHDLDFAIAVPLQEKLKLVTKNTPARGFFSWFKRDPSSSYVFVKDGYTGICLAKGQFYGFRKFSDRTIWLESFVAEADLFRKAYKTVLEDVKYWNKYRTAFAAKCKELAKKYTFSKDANRIAYELDYLILDIVPNLGKYASGLDYVNTGTFPANDKTMIIENIAVPSDNALNQLRELEKEAYVAFSQSITMPPADNRVTQYEDFFTFSDLIMDAFGVSKEEAYAMVYHGIINIDGPTNYFLTNTNNSVFTFLYILTCFSKVAHLVTLGGKVYHSTLSEFYDMVNVEDNIK